MWVAATFSSKCCFSTVPVVLFLFLNLLIWCSVRLLFKALFKDKRQRVNYEELKLACISRTKSFLQSNSAESVAMGLLRQFEGMQLPAASELDWLVPEHDAPQKVQHLLFYYYLAKRLNGSCSWILNLVWLQELHLSALFSRSCCPSPTPCRSHPTTGNTQTSTSWGFECEETWNGRRRDHKSSSTFTLLPSESRAGSTFNLYPFSMVTGGFIMFAGTLSCFFMMHVNLRIDQKHSRIV